MLMNYLDNTISGFRNSKALAERAIAQISDRDFFATLDEESNSIATIMKHMAGNMHSRWTDFLRSDGEKPNRNRDSEFVIGERDTKENLIQFWESGWGCLFAALESLTVDDLGKTIRIRSEPHTAIEAINRQLTHYAYHVGQIVFLAKHFAGRNWQTLSVPRGKSEEFTKEKRKKWEA